MLIHVDIWGGYSVPSHFGARYFLTIVDDSSRATWVYLMQHKSETKHYLKLFIAPIKTQFGRKVQKIRTDNGVEFFSRDISIFFENEGIIHEHSFVGTPQQNGVVECKHRHLLEVARALHFSSSFASAVLGSVSSQQLI